MITRTKQKKLKIMIIAGEISGDIHGALLMQQIKKLYNNVEFIGIGGKNMIESGLTSIIDISEIAVVGFVEVLKHGILFTKLLRKCKEMLLKEAVDCFIPIDYPGFNIKVAKYARGIEIPVYYYIAPQLWAWGKNRWKKLKKAVTKLLVVFPFEEVFFNKHNIPAKFVGHPLLDNELFHNPIKTIDERENVIAFFPGSRKQEIRKNLELFATTAVLLDKKLNNFTYEFAVANNLSDYDFELLKYYNFKYKLNRDSKKLMSYAKIGIVKTGTTTLEASLLGMNMIMAYKTSFTHYLLGKCLINLDFISLPNILLNKEVIPEFIQNKVTPKILEKNVLELLNNKNQCLMQQKYFAEIKNILGYSGASFNAANIILQTYNIN